MAQWIVSAAESGQKLVTFLKSKIGEQASARQLKALIERNHCKINGRLERFASKQVGTGDSVVLDWDEKKVPKVKVQQILEKERILFEDEYLIILNKPSGITSDQQGVENLIRRVQPEWRLVHRLDKETSGALIFAKSEEVFQKMVALFREMKVEKEYLAIVDGTVKNDVGVIENFLGKLREYQGQAVWGEVNEAKGLCAKTEWKNLSKGKIASMLLCKPKSGRTHQLRVHLSEMGHPILGDYHYCREFKCSYKPGRLLLHASRLSFPHPVLNKNMEIEAPIPADFQEALNALGL